MSADYRDQLVEVFTRVAERITFMFAEAAEKETLDPPSSPFRRVDIAFRGDFHGALTMWIPLDARTEITANVLGEEETCCDGSDDTLGELMNMICGNFLTLIVGHDGVLDLTPPQCHESPEDWDDLVADPGAIAFLLDEHPVFLAARVEGEVGRAPGRVA